MKSRPSVAGRWIGYLRPAEVAVSQPTVLLHKAETNVADDDCCEDDRDSDRGFRTLLIGVHYVADSVDHNSSPPLNDPEVRVCLSATVARMYRYVNT